MPVRPLRISGFDKQLMGIVSPTQSRVLDHVLPKLGRAADHGKLWIGLAATMAATPRRDTRRAALRGLASVSLASASANLVGKTLIRRQRPGVVGIPLIRQLRRVPDSSSFPSGRPRLEDGDLDIRIVDAGKPLARVRLLAALATGTLANSRVYQYRAATTLTLSSATEELGYCVDGEAADAEARLDVGKEPRSLIVYRPARPVV